ncbi:FMN-binding protein [Micromonospora sp. NPDC126480]|uniref:FMN-binding protein n=1 Tax=Micromonospora sp. NPDC126480 TaxID=3155312 RepID=UPI00331D651F
MRRALLAITGLAASTTALVVLKSAPGASQVAQDLPAEAQPAVPGGAAPAGAETSAAPSASAAAPKPSRSAARAPATRPSPTSGARTPSARKTSSKPAQPTTRTVTGPVVENEYGNVQVQITLSGSRIVDAVALELPEDTAQSDQRSRQVDDTYSGTSGLVVELQGADLDTVSGATATSTAYRQSLQAALDRAS